MEETIEVSADLLESLDISLEALVKNLLKDVSEVTNIPYKDLLKTIYGNGKLAKITLTGNEPKETKETICKGLIEYHKNGFLCRKPTISGSSYCTTCFSKPTHFNITNSLVLRKVKGPGTTGTTTGTTTEDIYSLPNGLVVNKQGIIKGFIKDTILYTY